MEGGREVKIAHPFVYGSTCLTRTHARAGAHARRHKDGAALLLRCTAPPAPPTYTPLPPHPPHPVLQPPTHVHVHARVRARRP